MAILYDEFLEKFNEDLDEISQIFGTDRTNTHGAGRTFECWIAHRFLGFSLSDTNEIVIGEPGDKGIDIGSAGRISDTILLVQCKYSDNIFQKKTPSYGPEVIDELIRGIKKLEENDKSTSDSFNRLRDDYKFSKNLQKPLRKVVCVTGKFNDDARKLARENNIEIYGLNQILRYVRDMDSFYAQSPSEIRIPVVSENFVVRRDSDNEIKAVILPIHSYTIYQFVNQYGDAIFAQNLRLRLPYTRQGSIGREIKEKALSLLRTSTPYDDYSFEILNNGLNIVCDSITFSSLMDASSKDEYKNFHDGKIVEVILFRPQVVNGCQTSWALHDAVETRRSDSEIKSEDDLFSSNVYVWAKIVPTHENTQLIDAITLSSNTQNPITKIDYRANHPIHLKIKEILEKTTIPIFYENKRGLFNSFQRYFKGKTELEMFKISGTSYRKIGIEDLAQLSMAWQGKPHIARAAKKSIFDNLDNFNEAFNLAKLDESENLGMNVFETIVFTNGIKRISDIMKKLYDKKDKLIRKAIQNPKFDKRIKYVSFEDYLQKRNNFCSYVVSVRFWNYLILSLIKGIVDLYYDLYDNKANKREIYKRIFDFTDEDLVNLSFRGKDLIKQFTYDANPNSDQLIDGRAAQPNVKLQRIAQWMESFTSFIPEAIKYVQAHPGYKFTKDVKNFIEQKNDAYSRILDFIQSEILGDRLKRESYFPGLE